MIKKKKWGTLQVRITNMSIFTARKLGGIVFASRT